jgi:restriction endonuclease Mrr
LSTANPAEGDLSTNYSTEILTSYQRAYAHNITTMAPIENALPTDTIIRQHLAKMVVNYALNVLGRTLPEKVPASCHRKDGGNARESQEMKDYATKACQLGLMGMDMDYFQPLLAVTRAQFGTILSRLLWQTTYAGGKMYYTNHLQALKDNGIMNDIATPEQRQELRQRVWLMLMRSTKN